MRLYTWHLRNVHGHAKNAQQKHKTWSDFLPPCSTKKNGSPTRARGKNERLAVSSSSPFALLISLRLALLCHRMAVTSGSRPGKAGRRDKTKITTSDKPNAIRLESWNRQHSSSYGSPVSTKYYRPSNRSSNFKKWEKCCSERNFDRRRWGVCMWKKKKRRFDPQKGRQ